MPPKLSLSHRPQSPAAANRAVRGGTMNAASNRVPPKRRLSSHMCAVSEGPRHPLPRTWYGDPEFVSGGRHPNVLCGNTDEVNHFITVFDNLHTAQLLDSVVGIASRLGAEVQPIAHARSYRQPSPERDLAIVTDEQRVIVQFLWPVTTAINQLLAVEYLLQDRSQRHLADMDALDPAASAPELAEGEGVASSSGAAKRRGR
jgi:hypothetical protein